MKPNEYKTPDPSFREILRLHELLEKEQIEHEFLRLYDGWQVLILRGDHVISAIEHFGSCGHEDDRIEIAGYRVPNDPVGWMTAEDCFELIKNNFTAEENNARD